MIDSSAAVQNSKVPKKAHCSATVKVLKTESATVIYLRLPQSLRITNSAPRPIRGLPADWDDRPIGLLKEA
jgi:hypothetical protein